MVKAPRRDKKRVSGMISTSRLKSCSVEPAGSLIGAPIKKSRCPGVESDIAERAPINWLNKVIGGFNAKQASDRPGEVQSQNAIAPARLDRDRTQLGGSGQPGQKHILRTGIDQVGHSKIRRARETAGHETIAIAVHGQI